MSGSSPRLVMDQRDRMNQAINDLFNADSNMEYFTIPADKDDMSPVLESLDTSRKDHHGSDLYKMVDDYEHHFHVSHQSHSISLSLTPAVTSFDLMDQNEKWQVISSHTRESTPLVSPAITPSVTYRNQAIDGSSNENYENIANDVFSSDDLELTPLSSPAIIPQMGSEAKRGHLDNFDAVERHLESLEQAKSLVKKQLADLKHRQYGAHQKQQSLDTIETLAQEKGLQQLERNTRAIRKTSRTRASHSPYENVNKQRKAAVEASIKSPTTASDSLPTSMPPPTTSPKGNSWSMLDNGPHHSASTAVKSSDDVKPATPSSIMNIRTKSRSNSSRSSSVSDFKPVTTKIASSKPSPRALRPLLVSPTLDVYSSIEDAAKALEAKSNYQNLREGKTDVLGIKFSPGINAGLENRRSAHKKAEKRRRDSLKDWFNKLREEISVEMEECMDLDDDNSTETSSQEPGQDKVLSKLSVLSRTCDYMKRLKTELKRRDDYIADLEQKLNSTEAVNVN
ncbi:hypothetical protein INT43_007513 [Umbelopsis isabellina]|uniref:BHLH domain-containing protein n=1 Tax=Mortierella isabellina TaxID=91625 RepID=A0A8H7PYG5_MORIS|nr:hypothetical protein INT43_007513 [Umbelopsis isabellina]